MNKQKSPREKQDYFEDVQYPRYVTGLIIFIIVITIIGALIDIYK